MYSIEERYEFYKEILSDFVTNLKLSILDVMVLEAISYKLDEIDKLVYNAISNSAYSFEYNGKKILNMFLNEGKEVNPITEYGKDIINKSMMLEIINTDSIDKLDYIYMDKICKEKIEYILHSLNLDYRKYKFNNVFSQHYFSKYYFEFESDLVFDTKNTTKEQQRNTILYMINMRIPVDFNNLNGCLISYYRYRNVNDEEKLRILILDFLQKKYPHIQYNDFYRFINQQNKLDFNNSLLLLFKELYEYKYSYDFDSHCSFNQTILDKVHEVFKKEILVNYHIRQLFFDSIDILLNKPNDSGYAALRELISLSRC